MERGGYPQDLWAGWCEQNPANSTCEGGACWLGNMARWALGYVLGKKRLETITDPEHYP